MDDSVIGGREFVTMAVGERCGDRVIVYQVGTAAVDGRPFRAGRVTVWRYRYEGSKGAVRSWTGSGPAGQWVRVWRSLPVHRVGWAGYVTVTVQGRVIALHV